MSHFAVREWGRIPVGAGGLTRVQANGLVAAARAHRLGGEEGTQIVSDHHQYLRAKQCVGVLATPGCSLEILPKVDPEAPEPEAASVRAQLIRMLDAAIGLSISEGELAPLARQDTGLLDILIRIFADRLIGQARQGLPRTYQHREDDLRALRGRLDVRRQFTAHAVRPDRLACRFDDLSVDTPLMQIMRASVVFLSGRARSHETQRRLAELRLLFDGVRDVPVSHLPWNAVRIDRSNRKWMALFELARLFLMREWQSTHHDVGRPNDGISLLFPMHELFEATVAAALRRALAPYGLEVISQGGFRYCLGEWSNEGLCKGTLFRTKPDIIIRSAGRVVAVADTKWKCLRNVQDERKRGIAQGDVYQLMAYGQLYGCDRLLMLYPHHPGLDKVGVQADFGVAVPGRAAPDRLQIVSVDVSQGIASVTEDLRGIVFDVIAPVVRSARSA